MKSSLPLATLVSALVLAPLVAPAWAEDATPKSVAELYKDRTALAGKPVTVKGKVVKANNQIMERNWVHLRDGTGNAADGTNDITVTTQDSATPGDEVTAVGTLVVDMDFGSGYRYPLLIEKATVTKAP
jgi:hypothetical protein